MRKDNFEYGLTRRNLLGAGAAGATLLAMPACTTGGFGGLNFTEIIRRLLDRSSKSAFAMMLQPGGFYDNSLTRIALPDRLGGSSGSGVLGVVLGSSAFRGRLQKELNKAAEKGAERAAPLVADTIKSVSIDTAEQIMRGGPQAATGFLRGKMGTALMDAMLPGVGDALSYASDDVVRQAVKSVAGFDIGALAGDITQKADNAIWSAIGAEEANIRSNPQATNDPLLIGAFGIL